MPGYNPQQLAYNARNGNLVAAWIGDQIVYYAQTVTHGTPFGTEGLYGVGNSKPQEIQQLKVAPHISLEMFDLTEAGINLLTNGTSLLVNLANTQFNISLYDGQTNSILFTYVGAVAQDFSQSVPANQIIHNTVTFLALDVLDSNGVSILNVPQTLQIPNATPVNANSLGS